ncbi:carbohydrate-binding protein [Lysobacter sp. Root690]|uniref:carbohydrate-binding protein n=1 Tax=Lysobacter sp. Root690 TaxID=1736588 RepID=UPI0006FC74D2|nr:carbohydrate-binding protein [Lysobacter sp. Root690]KRB02392.1 glycoside hydrolase family 16 [Lysobacter sp. Root690]
MKLLMKGMVFLVVSLFAGGAWAQNWQLVWSDEFNGSIGPDWVFETGNGSSGWGNNELEYYRRENAGIENNALAITARREDFGGFRYTSARMKTQGIRNFKYGKIEARMKLPSFMGAWPAFWALGANLPQVGWPDSGEIDIMEHVNNEDRTYGTIHWRDHNGNYAQYGGNTLLSVTDWHVYSVEWDANAIRWYVDGNKFHEASIQNSVNGTEEFHRDFFLLLNFAIGGNWPGFNVDESKLPAKMLVDYVRVYNAGGSSPWSRTLEAESFAAQSGVQVEACSEGGSNVGWIDSGDWLSYSNVNFPSSGSYRVEYRVSSPGGGALSLDLNAGGTVLGQVQVPATGGWQNWQTVAHTVNVNAGTYNLGVYAQQGGWNINWIRITRL